MDTMTDFSLDEQIVEAKWNTTSHSLGGMPSNCPHSALMRRLAAVAGEYPLTASEAFDQIVSGAIRYYKQAAMVARMNVEYPTSPEYKRLSLKLSSLPRWRRWFSWRLRRRVSKLQLAHRQAIMDAVLEAIETMEGNGVRDD